MEVVRAVTNFIFKLILYTDRIRIKWRRERVLFLRIITHTLHYRARVHALGHLKNTWYFEEWLWAPVFAQWFSNTPGV